MVDTDWKEILSFSQRELTLNDKEKLCESLCWMEADDIELNFTDLKTLFRLAQDILKLKSEQVNNLVGQLKTTQRRSSKSKLDSPYAVSPTQSNDSALETITHQEEIIRANKEILEQLYADIADLESRKSKLEDSRSNLDIDSESSRDALSEMNAVAQLEQEVSMKNKHIRKLLSDVKILEEENTKLKDKVSILKDKLTEATQLISNLTEQMVGISNECSQLKEFLGKAELQKAKCSVEVEALRKELFEKDSDRKNIFDDIKSKVQHWKNIAKSKKTEVEALSSENTRLKEDLVQASKRSSSATSSPKKSDAERAKIKELQEKLIEASNEIEKSAKIIDVLRAENRQLKSAAEEAPDCSTSEVKNESDDGKERSLINKLKKKIKTLTLNLQGAEEMIGTREKELTEITSQLQLLRSDEGINALLEGLKNKKRQLKFKDEGIKTLVQETNTLNQLINDLQLENETLRQRFNIPPEEVIPTTGILEEYHDLKKINSDISKEFKKLENKLVGLELSNRNLKTQIINLSNFLKQIGHTKTKVEEIAQGHGNDNIATNIEEDGLSKTTEHQNIQQETIIEDRVNHEREMEILIEENKGLRKGLQEILDFLKDNSKTSSGILTLQCPSLEAILLSMDARNSAGWFAPHMSTVMELRAALGGKDALLTALHEARKETFDVMTQLSEATEKTSQLEQKLHEIELNNKQKEVDKKQFELDNTDVCEFGSWISEKDQNCLDFYDKSKIENLIEKGNVMYENQLKKGLEYFHRKFKDLFDKLTSMSVQMSDERNQWAIQEERYKAEVQNLKSQLQQDEDDFSDHSPGMIPIIDTASLQRKCSYLEDSYRHIRTLNENMKNEIMESKRDAMVAASEYESKIQRLIFSAANLTDKLRCSISIDLFWKQNIALNEITSKYRKLVEENISIQTKSSDLCNRLEADKIEIINGFRREFSGKDGATNDVLKMEMNIEETISQKQIQQLLSEMEEKNKEIKKIKIANKELQEKQGQIIDENLGSMTREEINLINDQIKKLTNDNKNLKEQCQHVGSQLDIALLQLQDAQQRQMSCDMEINMLQHQILDLQSTSDNKAIIARLSGEILIAHLQSSESHKRIERLSLALNKEKEMREEAEEMLQARQKIFDVYALRYDSKFRYMFKIMNTLRQQYQGSIPLLAIENFLNNLEELARKNHAVDEKLTEIEDLRSSLITKHSVFDQILDVSKENCVIEGDSCPHKLKYLMMQSIKARDLEHISKKLKTLEQSREELIKHCNYLEKTLVLVNQGFEKSAIHETLRTKSNGQPEGENGTNKMQLEDIHSDDDSNSQHKSRTVTLTKPQILKQPDSSVNPPDKEISTATGSPKRMTKQSFPKLTLSNMFVQTIAAVQKDNQSAQTEEVRGENSIKSQVQALEVTIGKRNKEITEAMTLIKKRSEEILDLNKDKISLESSIQSLKDSNNQKDTLNERLRFRVDELRKQIEESKNTQITELNKLKENTNEENKSLILALKQLENDKNSIVAEYKELLNNEREEYAKTVKELQVQIMEMQSKLDRRGSESSVSNGEALKEVVTKYTMKVTELEDKCFKLQSELDDCKTELMTYQSEAERWKELATERLSKMEQLNIQLEERHCHEVKSYKAENQHWLSQINDMQREHMDLRTRLTDQKTAYMKQLSDKDTQIEQLRAIINNLKTQIMNMQTVISVNDPSFDLSAIVEVDETSDVLSQHGSDKLELKFDSAMDFHDSQDDVVRVPASSTAIWQEPVIERLRREKQMAGKQNAILRRQIKVLASRERRARLDAQNLKNQVFRISTTGNKVTTAETATLHTKIAQLQAQLTSARRDTHSSIALWDKWKRAQQAAERWQARYEERCQEVVKLEASLHLTKSALGRLDKEKRVLLSRLNETKSGQLSAIEKQEAESPEKSQLSQRSHRECICGGTGLPVSSQALLDRVEAQQRRIAALEVAEKGNELLVSEYEKSLAEITSLKGQVLKLESTLLESQIRTPIKSASEAQPELDYWKSYCEMLKEENIHLTHKITSMETLPTSTNQHRVNDLEQTVLTLRGVINKLQSEQKSGTITKRVDSRPSSSRSYTEKGRTQIESHRIEIINLKRSIHDKDLLLEKSKEMLKIAAEREDELLRENAYLRRQLAEITKQKGGFLSA